MAEIVNWQIYNLKPLDRLKPYQASLWEQSEFDFNKKNIK